LNLSLNFPDNLPVSAKRDEIMALMREHQVVVVCGETGSGKTTQLPKMALALGKGRINGGGLIGHTQPRRIAASSVAKRIAEELKSPLGDVVGYKVRFQDRLSKDASVKLMTDGILLAETQTDPLLKAYDTIIIDEAHERSLNIDFLLGYLRQLLPRRPDLQVIVTSATIDAQRFANYFASRKGPAPVIQVSGRTYPVEVRWRPFEESKETDLNTAIADGVDELWRGGPSKGGDILVFLPGEREIREAADHLRQHFSHQPMLRDAQILPLFARLSQAEQDRVFETGGARRVVLATNVAETSLTVPGIRYVIDAGTARVKRYSYRQKVEQLLVEPISQAAANQRSGRCGRVADGIAIRLYAQDDFQARPAFTDPEILRSSLAAVILRMKALHLGDIEQFTFIEPPPRRAIVDGYQLLNELGAVDDDNQLTPVGKTLSRLPVDPRVGRMLLEAQARGALAEVMVLASAMSLQDVRDRPLDKQAQADQAHKKFDDERSEFVGTLRLWAWLARSRGNANADTLLGAWAKGGSPEKPEQSLRSANAHLSAEHRGAQPVLQAKAATPQHTKAMAAKLHATLHTKPNANVAEPPAHKVTNRQYEQLLRDNFIHVRRVREWRDIYQQLHTVVAEHGWKLNDKAASFEALHKSLLAGLLGNIGFKNDVEEWYLGARGIKFVKHPGANLSKKPGKWVVCAELVQTTRLFGRGMASIEPKWLEEVGGHLLKKQLLDPHWEKKSAQVVALERATLYGLVVYSNRRIRYDQVDPVLSRTLFIREGLVGGEWDTKLAFLRHNQRLVHEVLELEHKSRRQDVLVDDALIEAYYDQHLPDDVASGDALERWYKRESVQNKQLLVMTRESLMRHEASGITHQAFPKVVRLGGVDCKASYLHEPGDAKDGLTVDVPLFALNQVDPNRVEWLVPGMLKDKLQALLKSLPQRPRSRLVPLPQTAQRMADDFSSPEAFGDGSLMDACLAWVRKATELDVKRAEFKLDMVPAHWMMNIRVVDEHGRQLGMGRQLSALKAELGGKARGAFQALAQLKMSDLKLQPAQSDQGQTQAGGARASHTNASGSLGNNNSNKSNSNSNSNSNGSSAPKIGPKSAQAATAQGASGVSPRAATPQRETSASYTAWTFGELPELMELRQGGQTLIGFPALVDAGDCVRIEVFDEPQVAAAKHRLGLTRLFALQIKDAIKYLEKNIPDMQLMSVAYMPLGTADELRTQILNAAMQRAFLLAPLPEDAGAFETRLKEGRARLTLIANELARTCSEVLAAFAKASRKLKDSKQLGAAHADATQQLARLMPKQFVSLTPTEHLPHLVRYLNAVVMRLDKARADMARDAAHTQDLNRLEQAYWRLVSQRQGNLDESAHNVRWLLEELRVGLFAQELRTKQPVSVKRLEKALAQLQT
jgi:ATP-dependent helicase HrpA